MASARAADEFLQDYSNEFPRITTRLRLIRTISAPIMRRHDTQVHIYIYNTSHISGSLIGYILPPRVVPSG